MAPSWAGVGGRGGWRKEVEVQWGRSLGRWGGWAWPKMRPQRGRTGNHVPLLPPPHRTVSRDVTHGESQCGV